MSHGESIMDRAQRAADESQTKIVIVDDPFAENPEDKFAYCPLAAKDILFRHAVTVCVIEPKKR